LKRSLSRDRNNGESSETDMIACVHENIRRMSEMVDFFENYFGGRRCSSCDWTCEVGRKMKIF
jgi:hypothetical protein